MTGHPSSLPGAGGLNQPPVLWDPLVRITHWGVALVVVLNGLLVKPGGLAHLWAGWVALALLALRLIWGFVGPKPARFGTFLPDPVGAMRHLSGLLRGRVQEYPSHNPAGALMVWALWASLAVVIATGLVMTDGKTPMRMADEKAAVAAGDWSVLVTEGDDEASENGALENGAGKNGEGESGEMIQEIHEVFANLILLLAVLHIGGVLIESRALGRNLVRPMTIGTKPPRGGA